MFCKLEWEFVFVLKILSGWQLNDGYDKSVEFLWLKKIVKVDVLNAEVE